MELRLGRWTLFVLATLWKWDDGAIDRRTFSHWQLVALINERTDEEWSLDFSFGKLWVRLFRHHIPAYWWRI